jgi:hypothetical protein
LDEVLSIGMLHDEIRGHFSHFALTLPSIGKKQRLEAARIEAQKAIRLMLVAKIWNDTFECMLLEWSAQVFDITTNTP